ncbi:TolC family protein [Verrucomicrobium sp. GAS474]|uniref:TolC family protein n=1 Tax=Verrucomicrobium sp. GAS474 TaxID=1882831 RepID=UPI0012FFA6FF|nr:TolC family protein [Verrucomicrobium sp. GAS474]
MRKETLFLAMGLAVLFSLSSSLFSEETPPAASPASAVSAPAATSSSLTWADCIRLAAQNSTDLQAAREAVLNSDAVRRGAYSTLYPQMRISFGDNRSYVGPGPSSTQNYATAYQEQLSLTQTIFDGFATKGNIEQGKAQLALAFANLNAQKAATSYSLKSSFAQLLYAQELLDISDDVIEIRKSAALLVQRLYEGGQEDKGAMLLSQANYDKSVNDLEQARRVYVLSGRQLGTAIGKILPAPVTASGELLTTAPPSEGPDGKQPEFDKLAVTTPAYYQQKASVDAAAAGITQATSGWYPTITAGVSGGRTGSDFPAEVNGWSAGLNASYPIFNGGQTYFNVKAATASFRQTLALLASGTNQAAMTLAQSYTNFLNARDNVRIQQEILDANVLRYRIAEARYKNGLMTFQDFNSIVDTYVGQKKSALAARRDAVLSEASWEQARGLGAIP